MSEKIKKYESETVKTVGLDKGQLAHLKEFVETIKSSNNMLLRNSKLTYRNVVDLAFLFATEYVKTTLNQK